MACFVSDGFQESLGESLTALKLSKLGGLVLAEEQKAALYCFYLYCVYVFYRRVLESPLFFNLFLLLWTALRKSVTVAFLLFLR